MRKQDVDLWFVQNVLPLEAQLSRFLQRRLAVGEDEVIDLRQETYARVYEGVLRGGEPLNAQAFVLTVAKNILIDRARRKRVVFMEYVADIEAMEIATDVENVSRGMIARLELSRFDKALKLLPSRCAEVVKLRKIQQLSQREVAQKMGITEATVERQLSKGVRLLAQAILAEDAPLQSAIKNGQRAGRL